MKTAFLISASKDARHLRDLVGSLPGDASFYIHVDSKRDLNYFESGLDRPNVHFIGHRVNVVEGSMAEVECQVELLRAALDDGVDGYMVYLDGGDYPLWNNERIEECFSKADGKEFIRGIALPGLGKAAYPYTDFHPLARKPWRKFTIKGQARVSLRRLLNGLHLHKTLRVYCPEKTYTVYKGASAWAITPDLARTVVSEWDGNERLKTYFSTSIRPSETFVQTVAFNSERAGKCMLVKGRYQGIDSLSPITYIDGGPVAKTLTEVDFSTLKACDKMFCRQMATGYSDGLKSMIDADRAAHTTAEKTTDKLDAE